MALIDTFVTQLDARFAESERIVTRTEGELVAAAPAQPCAMSARAVYELLNLANPRARLAQLAAVRSAVVLLREALTRDYITPGPARWQGAEYRLGAEIRPTRESAVTVAIRVTYLRFDVDESSGAPVAIEESAGSDTLVARRFSRFATEFAVATVIGSVTRPGYGTTRTTRVQRSSGGSRKGSLQWSPESWPAWCAGARRARSSPHAASWHHDVERRPGILGGGGIRLFGLPKGEVALGAGGMLAWVKDLRTLHVGDPVGGTSDIEEDLHYERRHGWYAALQYKF